jgi:hypothetical protein
MKKAEKILKILQEELETMRETPGMNIPGVFSNFLTRLLSPMIPGVTVYLDEGLLLIAQHPDAGDFEMIVWLK